MKTPEVTSSIAVDLQAIPDFPRMEIVYKPIGWFREYIRNPRKNDGAVDRMCASIREFGFAVPMLCRSTGEIVDGHLRFKGAKKLDIQELPTILCDHWTEGQVKAFRLMVNRSVQWAEWDDGLLSLELLDLKNLDFDLGLTGFDEQELARLLAAQEATDGLCDEDDVPSAPQTPTSKVGDLWLLGGHHRLLCGDSTDPQTVSRLCGSVKPMLLVTDQPYGVQYDPEWRKRAGVNNSNRMGKVRNDDRADWREVWALFPGDVAYVWHGGLHASTVADSLEACGFEIRSQLVWAKPSLVMGRGHYHWQHEPCWYAVRGTGHWNGDRKQSTLWHIENRNQDAETVHSTQKPVECMRRPIVNNSSPGQAVYEPFCGSGTTIIACEKEARIALAIELEPAYIDVAVTRWQNFTGKEAVLDGDGRSFEQIAQERRKEAT
ncbi:MAG: DNA methyltransferase [Bryobacteraceae bacterium]|jgi:DNA modification methylase